MTGTVSSCPARSWTTRAAGRENFPSFQVGVTTTVCPVNPLASRAAARPAQSRRSRRRGHGNAITNAIGTGQIDMPAARRRGPGAR